MSYGLIKFPRASVDIRLWHIGPSLYADDSLSLIHTYIQTNSVAQEPEDSSPHAQQPATGSCPEPVESNPHPPSQSPQDTF
jgi:hypothetical protein